MATSSQQLGAESWIEAGAFTMRTERDPVDLYVVELFGELDLSGAESALRELERVRQSDVKEIIVDLSGLDFIDSSGLAVLCQIYRQEREGPNRVVFLRAEGLVQRVFDITHLSSELPFVD